MRRKRRSTQEGEFKDPLNDYSPTEYADGLERALIEDEVTLMKTAPVATIEAGETVEQALRMMAEKNIACVVVKDGDRLAGVFSERDVLMRVVDHYDEVKGKPVSEIMTSDSLAVYDTDSPAQALSLMAVSGFRHVPIVDVDDKLVGILGPRRVISYLQQKFAEALDGA